MAQYIDKSALVAEIRRRMKNLIPLIGFTTKNPKEVSMRMARIELEKLLSFINTLEVKEGDFEKLWKEYFKFSDDVAAISVKPIAKHFFELGLKAQKEE